MTFANKTAEQAHAVARSIKQTTAQTDATERDLHSRREFLTAQLEELRAQQGTLSELQALIGSQIADHERALRMVVRTLRDEREVMVVGNDEDLNEEDLPNVLKRPSGNEPKPEEKGKPNEETGNAGKVRATV